MEAPNPWPDHVIQMFESVRNMAGMRLQRMIADFVIFFLTCSAELEVRESIPLALRLFADPRQAEGRFEVRASKYIPGLFQAFRTEACHDLLVW